MPHKNKLCAICGKIENRNWAYHWKQQHKGSKARELVPGEVPEDAYDDNWLFIAKNKDEKIFDIYATAMGMLDPPAPPTPNPQAIDNHEYIEIIDEEDEPEQIEEETLNDPEQKNLGLDLSSMKTPDVIRLVDDGLNVITERLRGRESALSTQLGLIAKSLQISPSTNGKKGRLWLNVRNKAYKALITGKQKAPTNNSASATQKDFNNYLNQKAEVLNNIKDVEFAINTLREISLSVWLSINQGIGEIGYCKQSLKARSKQLLQPTPCKEKFHLRQPTVQQNLPPLTQAQELAISFPYLYDTLDRLAEKQENKEPVPIEVEEMTDKVELKKGISLVDITRQQLHRVRQAVKRLDWSKIRSLSQIKAVFLKEINKWRLQLNRGFQQFMNAMFISHYKVDGLNTQVTLIFEGNQDQRSYSISTMPKEKRKFTGSANDHYQAIEKIAKNTGSLCESIEKFATAIQSNNARGLKIYLKVLLKAIESYQQNSHHKDHQKVTLKHTIDETIQLILEASTPKKQDMKLLKLTKGTFNNMKEYVLGKMKNARKSKMSKHK